MSFVRQEPASAVREAPSSFVSLKEFAAMIGESTRNARVRVIDREQVDSERVGERKTIVIKREDAVRFATELLAQREAKLEEAKAAMTGAAQ